MPATDSRARRKSRGYTMVELIMVLMILVMLCATVFTLIFSGQRTYQRINANRVAAMNTRDALAYVDMRIRQNDFISGVQLAECPLNGGNCLIINDLGNDRIATWIYFDEGKLYEYTNLRDMDPVVRDSTMIAELDSFDVTMDENNVITKTVTYTAPETGQTRTITSSVALRSVQ